MNSLDFDDNSVAKPEGIVGTVEVCTLDEQPDSGDEVDVSPREGEQNLEAQTEEEIIYHVNAFLQNDNPDAQLDAKTLEFVEDFIDREGKRLSWIGKGNVVTQIPETRNQSS